MSATYLNDTSSMMVQNNTDNTPKILASMTGSGWVPEKVAWIAYKGLVPISPYTTPMAPSMRGGNFCLVCVLTISRPSAVAEWGGTLRLSQAGCNCSERT